MDKDFIPGVIIGMIAGVVFMSAISASCIEPQTYARGRCEERGGQLVAGECVSVTPLRQGK